MPQQREQTMKPVICNYYLTYRCNARCPFCAIWKDDTVDRSDEARIGAISSNIAALARAGVKIVDFTGGEPLLHPDLPEALAAVGRKGIRTTVTTNGVIYGERARELAGRVNILQFSLHGPDAERHDEVTGTPSFERVMAGVETARSLGEHPTFIHTVTDGAIETLGDVMALARRIGVPLFLNPAFEYPGTHGLSRTGLLALRDKARGPGVSIDRGFLAFLIDGGNRRNDPRCLAVSSTVVISPDDRLVLPCFHRAQSTMPIKGRLMELLDSPEVEKERRAAGRHDFCEGCGVYCYMRASLFRRLDRYCALSLVSAGKYLLELHRAPRLR